MTSREIWDQGTLERGRRRPYPAWRRLRWERPWSWEPPKRWSGFSPSKLPSSWTSCTVVNASVTGYNACQSAEWYRTRWSDHEFDAVIFAYCCLNDRTNTRVISRRTGRQIRIAGHEYVPDLIGWRLGAFLLNHSALARVLSLRLAPFFEAWGVRAGEYQRNLTGGTRQARKVITSPLFCRPRNSSEARSTSTRRGDAGRCWEVIACRQRACRCPPGRFAAKGRPRIV